MVPLFQRRFCILKPKELAMLISLGAFRSRGRTNTVEIFMFIETKAWYLRFQSFQNCAFYREASFSQLLANFPFLPRLLEIAQFCHNSRSAKMHGDGNKLLCWKLQVVATFLMWPQKGIATEIAQTVFFCHSVYQYSCSVLAVSAKVVGISFSKILIMQ